MIHSAAVKLTNRERLNAASVHLRAALEQEREQEEAELFAARRRHRQHLDAIETRRQRAEVEPSEVERQREERRRHREEASSLPIVPAPRKELPRRPKRDPSKWW